MASKLIHIPVLKCDFLVAIYHAIDATCSFCSAATYQYDQRNSSRALKIYGFAFKIQYYIIIKDYLLFPSIAFNHSFYFSIFD